MTASSETGGRSVAASVSVGGDLSGQFAAGNEITQQQVRGEGVAPPTAVELAELHALLAELKARAAAEAPPDKRDAAVERVEELEEAVTAGEPDLSTLEYVQRWFAKHAPQVLGSVTGLVFNPIVGKLVAAAGDALVREFQTRFGRTPPA